MRNASCLLAVLLLLGAPALAAQTIKGVVLDAGSGEPLADASVVLLDSKGAIQRGTLTEPDGSYSLACPKAGTYMLRVGGEGIATWDSPPMKVGADDTVEYAIRVVRAGVQVLAAFERRRATIPGTFLTREDIEAKGGQRFTDLFQHVAGVTVVGLPAESRTNPAFGSGNEVWAAIRSKNVIPGYYTVRLFGSRAGQGLTGAVTRGEEVPDCPPVLWVDGQWWGSVDAASETGPDFKLLPVDLAAVEIFLPGQVPQELNSGRDAELCGVVSLWRRQGRQAK